MIKYVNEKLVVSEYIYPYADKVKSKLQSQIESLNDPIRKPSNINAQFTGWHLQSKEANNIVQWVSDLMTHDFLWSVYTLKCVELWGVLYKKGDYITKHQHTPSLYSFVYYVNAPKGSSPLKFSTSGYKVKAQEGKVVIFDSRLDHEVPFNRGENRCVVSGNFIWDKETGTAGI